MSKTNYKSDIVLGERYVDKQTGYEGVATCITFFQHACERIILENYDAERKQVKEVVFDAPRLTHIATDKIAKTKKTGGPGQPAGQRGPAVR